MFRLILDLLVKDSFSSTVYHVLWGINLEMIPQEFLMKLL